LLSKKDVPFDSSLTFNAGVTKFQGRYVMLFRNDYGVRREDFAPGSGKRKSFSTNIGLAFSDDGETWDVQPSPLPPLPLGDDALRAYDPRLTVIDGRCHLCFAVDTPYGIRGGIAVTEDFERFDVLSLSVPDNRNFVLFPEKISGMYLRLERPFPIYGKTGNEAFDIWCSASPDLRFWGDSNLLISGDEIPFCNCKMGPAAPPVKTSRGWLTTFHAVWRHEDDFRLDSWEGVWSKEYLAGLMLLDLNDPRKIVGVYDQPLLVAETEYETKGFRGKVIFPGGMILEDSGEVKIYYGAADTVECMASAHVEDLIKLCLD
jgi:beta-1,4-mannooligosaccharide/beta-1,4-mannosyl-N-acetylglucosamine phosphorylase